MSTRAPPWSAAAPACLVSPSPSCSLEILGGTALTHEVRGPVELIDPGPNNAHESLRRLRPPEFFADCADGDAMQVWLCLIDAVEPGCLPGPLACPD